MNAENLTTLSRDLEAAQIHLNKLAGQIMDAAAELENLWTRIDLATVQLADPAELRESARRVLEREATPESLIDALTESVSTLQNECADLEAENADLRAQLDALNANR